MIRRIGFCCQWFHHDRTLKKKQLEEIERPMNTRATTVRWLNEHKDQAEEKLDFVFVCIAIVAFSLGAVVSIKNLTKK